MKKIILTAFLVLAAAVFGDIRVKALSPVEIYSSSAVLIDASTGQVLFDKNMDAAAYPASTTKIMTGIIAVENCSPEEMLSVSESAIDIDEPESTNIALSPGEELSFDNAMYAMMLQSANDAANVIAEHVAGTQEKFVEMMNEKAALIGAVNTSFANAHGLDDAGHYTTAHDMALITRYAIQNAAFMRYFGAERYIMPATNLQRFERHFANHQYMLVKTSQYYDEYVTGGKVGYTDAARHTMSTAATRGGRTLVCVVMGSTNRNEKFEDAAKLLEYGFGEFKDATLPAGEFESFSIPVMDGGETIGEALFKAESDFSFLLHNDIGRSTVKLEYTTPKYIRKGDSAEIELSIITSNAGGSSVLMTIPLKAELKLLNAAQEDSPETAEQNSYFYIIMILCAVVALWFSMSYIKQCRPEAGVNPWQRL